MVDFGGQNFIEEIYTAMPINPVINVVLGTDATLLEKPVGSRFLRMYANKGGFSVRIGDFSTSGMPAALIPASAVTDGSAGWVIPESGELVIPGATEVTVAGYAADSALTYYYY